MHGVLTVNDQYGGEDKIAHPSIPLLARLFHCLNLSPHRVRTRADASTRTDYAPY